jgi:hypothetical protein
MLVIPTIGDDAWARGANARSTEDARALDAVFDSGPRLK